MADDLDDLLDEVESKFCSSKSASKQSTCAFKQTNQKCANPEDKKQSRACNHLRCTSCDFSVIKFENHEWDSSCDFIFQE
ncbi:protein C8orf37 homolog isoform X2 [Carassius auratus]|uniref:Cilia- and flagella-associated protein 418 n=1 Tax=Carassius auratus TaxID=7957 RepID=A0A6P6LFV1_CARAU|nr:protein C8orf37 homolog isoform X2 [Carassius auratus]